jgi:hypothetical protein
LITQIFLVVLGVGSCEHHKPNEFQHLSFSAFQLFPKRSRPIAVTIS